MLERVHACSARFCKRHYARARDRRSIATADRSACNLHRRVFPTLDRSMRAISCTATSMGPLVTFGLSFTATSGTFERMTSSAEICRIAFLNEPDTSRS